MIEHIGRVNLDYMVRLANDPGWTKARLDELNDWNAAHGVLYGGHVIPVPVKPHFISPRQRRVVETALTRVMSALSKFVDHWLQDDELQALWGVSEAEMELYRVDPGYPQPIQLARLDAFLHEYDLQFLEFNCDSPGGTGYADMIHQGFLRLFEQNGMGDRFHVSSRQRLAHLVDALLECYGHWRDDRPREDDRPLAPFVVVTDWADVGSRPDIDITLHHMQQAGLDAVFADPREFTLKDGELFLGDRRVDLVYKRVIVKELVEEPAAAALADAYKAGTICLVNSPRSVIVGNKKILAALRRPDVLAVMDSEERKALRDHVPWTEVLADRKAEFQGYTVNLRDFTVDNRDKLVLKAAQSYGGKDVFLGFETSQADWEALVDKHIDERQWIVQRLVHIPKELFPDVSETNVNMKLMNVNINPLAFGGRYAGCYTRISEKNVINVSYGGGLLPTMTLSPREP